MIQAKLGDSIRLECNSTGDQPININWFREGSNETIDKHGNSLYDIHEILTDSGLVSILQIREIKQDDALLYKCQAKNEFGSSERLLKLIVLNPPERPSQPRVRDIWSRSVLVTWQSAPLGASRTSNYTIQYWRRNSLPSNGPVSADSMQNHRRESIQVDGLQSSALLVNLLPSLTYEVSVIAHNQVGQSEPSESISVTTSEEEPSAPPSDLLVEPKGSSTLRVAWKIPPIESLNGKLLGFYVGYRPRQPIQSPLVSQSRLLATSMQQLMQSPEQQPIPSQQPQVQNQQQSQVYSYKTAEAVEGQIYYDIFLTYLKPNQDYEITVRAFNKAGSGPDCHTILARTNGARLLQAPSLQVQRVTSTSVRLKWTISAPVLAAHGGHSLNQHKSLGALMQSDTLARYILYYQLQGEREWYGLPVESSNNNLKSQQQDQDVSIPGELNAQISGVMNEPLSSETSIHTLSNLRPNSLYHVYVAAVNEYGVGDPSNIVNVKTELLNGSQAMSSHLLPALLEGQLSLSGLQSATGGLFDNLSSQQQQYGLVFTSLSSIALLAILISLIGYLIWHRRCRVRYNSSSGSSYPSSWTQAASDTFQSEYSVKRLPQKQHQHLDVPEDMTSTAARVRSMQLAAGGALQNGHQVLSSTSSRQSREYAARNLNQFNLIATSRALDSNHYHQPADLLSGTIQFSHRSRHQHAQPATSTLNRTHQNRQLPPIPYTTLSVKEDQVHGTVPSKGWRAIPTKTLIGGQPTTIGIDQKQQQLSQGNTTIGSQSPLIYGVIE